MPFHDDRRRLALACNVLLGIVAVGSLVLVAARRPLGIESSDVKEILVIIFPTLSALAGGAATFYFRGKP